MTLLGGGAAMIPPWLIESHDTRLAVARIIVVVLIFAVFFVSVWLWRRG